MECCFSKTKKAVYWRDLQTLRTSWQRPVSAEIDPGDSYNPKKMKEKSDVTREITQWRESCNDLKRELYERRLPDSGDAVHLDIACGRGGDVHKWKHRRVALLVGMEKSASALEEATRRAAAAGVNARFYLCDVTKALPPQLQVELQKYVFSSVSCMFALHYFLESPQTFQNFEALLSSLRLRDKAPFFGTTVHYKQLTRLFLHNAEVACAEPLPGCRITRPTNGASEVSEVSEVSALSARSPTDFTGWAYDFSLDGSLEAIREYLVFFPTVEERFRKIGFHAAKILHQTAAASCGLYLSFEFVFDDGRRQTIPQLLRSTQGENFRASTTKENHPTKRGKWRR